ncbi:MAG: TolC family protein [Terriglobia bacterium]
MYRFLRILLIAVFPLALYAQNSPDGMMTIGQVTREAVDKNLGLMAERYNLSIADARRVTARLRPNPVFSAGADYQDILGSGFASTPGSSAGPPEVNFRVDFLLETGGKRHRRMELADDAKAVAEFQLLDATRLLILEVQNGVTELLLTKANLALAEENLKAFNEIVAINSAKVKAGELAEVELVRSKLAALQFQNAVRQQEANLRTARNRLQALMGRAVPQPSFDIAGDFRRDDLPLNKDTVQQQALQQRPDLQALARDEARAAADIKLQVAQGKVDYTVGTEYHHQYANVDPSANAMGFFVSVPLPIFNRNQGEIERARQEEHQIATRSQALKLTIQTEVDNAYVRFETARDMLKGIETNMLQQAREVRQTMEYSYRRGEASLVEFLDAQRAFNDTMQSYNEARAEFARSLYLTDSITGKVLNP